LIEVSKLAEDEVMAGLVLVNQVLFRLYFFEDELGLPPSKEQLLMFCDESDRVLFCTGRKIAKTVHLEASVIQFSILNEGSGVKESLFFTPREKQLKPFLDRLFSRLERDAFLRLLVKDKSRGDDSNIEFGTGLRWYFRIEGMSGNDQNVVGLRANHVIGDEQAFGTHAVFNSLLQTALPTAKWILAGVPNGVRNTPFYQLDQTKRGKKWSRHKYSTLVNPLYSSPEARQKLIDDYGGENTHDYGTQVMGDWREELLSSFPPHCIAVSTHPYYVKMLTAMDVDRNISNLALALPFPSIRCYRFAIGWDYGFSPDPTVMVGAYQAFSDRDEWRTYCRVVLKSVAEPQQRKVFHHLRDKVFIGTFVGASVDNQSTVQNLQVSDQERSSLYQWTKFQGVTATPIVMDDGTVTTSNVPNKQYATELLRSWMLNYTTPLEGRTLILGNDQEVVDEMGGTMEKRGSQYTVYIGPPDPNNSRIRLDHNTDAHRALVQAIDTGCRLAEEDDSEEAILGQMGWNQYGTEERQDYQVPF